VKRLASWATAKIYREPRARLETWFEGLQPDKKKRWNRVGKQIVDGFWEVGVLLMALAPLEWALGQDPRDPVATQLHRESMVRFLVWGFLFFLLSLFAGWGLQHDDKQP
jgi:hypothetical protein